VKKKKRAARTPARRAFKRQLADDRRSALIEATLRSLTQDGHDGLSVRSIAAHAGVSIGLINHHFPNKDELIAETYRHFHRSLLDSNRAAVAAAGESPRARMRAFFEAAFSPPNLDPHVLTGWLVFWSLYRHSREIQRVHQETYAAYLEFIHGLLADLHDATEQRVPLRLAAIGLTALLDGLWLEYCLDPDNFSPQEAVMLCEHWLDGLGAGKPG
jgi:AcrR family transcriptional regulator